LKKNISSSNSQSAVGPHANQSSSANQVIDAHNETFLAASNLIKKEKKIFGATE